ncbi:hypothetical protein BBO99_00004208 [Phytophthora kernoviae]|uniref:Protein SERAC1 n=2 Tax=Phytophthora kernoviae TaxID=325452 RepID=A0A3R7GXY3_9STRA|nr:hypothetical protein G195_006703 [Phytophthora kernoviae 00238/432]KAG2525207.1 hypothetical protein JM18_005007 [Phytophthora kernoviae]KAG2525917.1 hypothetical protein JM16_004177 [Phytophthora kernoviae]RLN02045.1 hypothetical protein BBI17_004380 [Phytophthora kernoviae]RLN80828.1 hypothetical protein BBO99_00004208 [Phytophthora kernoviae]
MLHVAKRPLLLLASASVSASAGFMYIGDGNSPTVNTLPSNRQSSRKTRSRALKATSRQELGLQQSLARDLACWVSSASVYAARQAVAATSSQISPIEGGSDALEAAAVAMKSNQMYCNLLGWLQQISPDANGWDPEQVLASSSFSTLVNLLSDTESSLSIQEDLEEELYRVVGVLSTNVQCVKAIAEKATRYGKQAMLNLALAHDDDPRLGEALHQLVLIDNSDCHFGPANLASLLSLAVADVPDHYLEFALWGLTKATTPDAVSRRYKWRKTILGDDSTAKTRRKLIGSDKLWGALIEIGQHRSGEVQLQAARLVNELSNDVTAVRAMQCHGKVEEILVQWMSSPQDALATASYEIVSKLAAVDHTFQQQLVETGALDVLRTRLVEDTDRRMTAKLLQAIRCLATPATSESPCVLDRDALSFVNGSDNGELLHNDDIENIHLVLTHGYVDGWIELFTAFLKSGDENIRDEAALCLQQMASSSVHKDQAIQEWLIAVLDSVLDKVPPEVARGSCSSENCVVQRETARVLANLFACDEMAEALEGFAMDDCQLEATLEKWTQSDDIRLQAMAHRASSNRRYQNSLHNGANTGDEVKYLDGIHPLHLPGIFSKQQGNYDVDVVFVHGLLGCPFETWTCGKEEGTVWAQAWLLEDMKSEGLNPRVLSVGLGGVLLKQVLMASANSEGGVDDSQLIDNVNGVVFFGVPHHGSPVAQTIQTFKPRQIAQHPVTEHLHGTPHLEMLNDWCAEVFEEKGISSLSVGESLPCRLPVIGVEALVVPSASADPGFGDFVPIPDATHVDVCKPASTDDVRYKLVRKFISKNATSNPLASSTT